MMAASVSMHFLKPLVIVRQLLSYSRIAAAAPVQQYSKPPAEYTLHDFRDYAGRVVVSLSSSGSSKFSGSIESKSGASTVQDLAVKKDANVGGDLSARRISTSGLIEARSLELKGGLRAEGAVSAGALVADSNAKIQGELNVLGEASFSKGIKVQGVVALRGDLDVVGDVSAKRIKGHIKTSGVSDATVASTTVSAKRSEVENLKVAGVITGDKLSSASVSTSSIEVNGILKATNSSIQQTLSIGKDVFVQETMQAKRISSLEDIRARGDIISDTKLVARDLEVTGTAEFSNATVLNAKITTLSTTENLFTDGEAHLGCVHASQVSVEIDGPVLNKANVTMEESLIVRDTIKAKRVATDVLSANRLSATSLNSTGNIFSNSTIRSSGRFFSQNGSVAVVNVSAANAMVSSGLDTSNLNVRKDVSISGNVNIDEGLSATNVTAESATFTGDVMLHGVLFVSNNTNVTRDIVTTRKVVAVEVEVEDGVSARSLFSSRIYTEDAAASGFISAGQLICKGDATVNGEVTARKVAVASELTINEVDIGKKLEEVERRVVKLEAHLRELRDSR